MLYVAPGTSLLPSQILSSFNRAKDQTQGLKHVRQMFSTTAELHLWMEVLYGCRYREAQEGGSIIEPVTSQGSLSISLKEVKVMFQFFMSLSLVSDLCVLHSMMHSMMLFYICLIKHITYKVHIIDTLILVLLMNTSKARICSSTVSQSF